MPAFDVSGVVFTSALQDVADNLKLDALLKPYSTLVRVAEIEGRGRGLVASRDIPKDVPIIVERSFCWQLDSGDVVVKDGSVPAAVDTLLVQLAPYCGKLSADVPRTEVVESTMRANAFAVTKAGSAGAAAAAATASGGAGGAGGGAASDTVSGRALFSVICLANHSCAPNCKVYQAAPSTLTGRDPPAYVLESRVAIAAGEELTIAYCPRAWHRPQRAAALAGYGFKCTCARCAAPGDDTIVTRCPHCEASAASAGGSGCGRVYWGAPTCCDCGKEVAVEGTPAAAAADPHVLDHILDTPQPAVALADALLGHAFLAPEDVRVFTALNQLLEAVSQAEDEDTTALFPHIAQAIAMASMRAGYTSPEDLGIEIETDE